jgi:carboxypeptidase D
VKRFLFCVSMILAGCGGADHRMMSSEAGDSMRLVRIPITELAKGFSREFRFDRESLRDDRWAFGWIDRRQIPLMAPETRASLTEVDAKTFREHVIDPETLEPMPRRTQTLVGASEPHHNTAALQAELTRLAHQYPTLTSLFSIGKSVKGRDVWALKIARDAASDNGNPKMLYLANIHGDETTGRELMIYLARLLLDSYGKDARLTRLVDTTQIFIVPGANPDGWEARRRFNANDFDLNRRFPDMSSDSEDSPLGRPIEVANVMRLHETNHFQLAANLHGGIICVNIPWDTRPNVGALKFEDDALMYPWAVEYAAANPEMADYNGGSFVNGVTYGYEWYEVDGGMQDWATYYRGSIHATLELSYVKWPDAAELPEYWEQNRESLVRYAEHAADGIHLELMDETGAPIVGAKVSVEGLRPLVFETNVIHRLALDGDRRVMVEAEGYAPKKMTVRAKRFDGALERVIMRR